ncbi:glutathione S-transferase 1-like [Haemaphysalis longicornis]
MAIDLYVFLESEHCQFIRMLAEHIGVELNLKVLDYYKEEHKTPEFSKISPLQTVPVMDDDGLVLYDRLAICYYLLNKYAPSSDLYPKDVQKRALVDQMLSLVASFIQPVASSYIFTATLQKKTLRVPGLTEFEKKILTPLEELVRDKTFAVGETLTLADIRLVSVMMCFIPLPVVDKTKFSKLASYYERISSQLPCFARIVGSTPQERAKMWESFE